MPDILTRAATLMQEVSGATLWEDIPGMMALTAIAAALMMALTPVRETVAALMGTAAKMPKKSLLWT